MDSAFTLLSFDRIISLSYVFIGITLLMCFILDYPDWDLNKECADAKNAALMFLYFALGPSFGCALAIHLGYVTETGGSKLHVAQSIIFCSLVLPYLSFLVNKILVSIDKLDSVFRGGSSFTVPILKNAFFFLNAAPFLYLLTILMARFF